MAIIFPSLLLALAISAFAQQTSVAVLPSDSLSSGGAVLSYEELDALTDKMREAALKVLPTKDFVLVKQDVIVKRLGGAEKYIKECSESSCIVDLGKKAMVDYVAQASTGKLGNKIRLKVELYNVSTEGQIGILNEVAENVEKLLNIVEKRVPAEIFGKIPGASIGKNLSPTFTGGISDVQTAGGTYNESDFAKRYVVNLNTEPSGAALSFNGVPKCQKTPCKVELIEGNVRIIANLEQYEIADTTVFIKQNNQSISIKLKPDFGILEIKPAYSEGIGKEKQWNLSINGKPSYFGEVRLFPNLYKVKLSHECYEDIDFNLGINKGSHEVFNMASNIILKKGILDLSAEQNDEPTSEPVFVNGKRVGETPFSGSVPLCSKVEIGSGRETVNVKLKDKEKVEHTHHFYTNKSQYIGRAEKGKIFTDTRDGKKYRTVVMGNQTWMAENLNYNASDSKCYDNQEINCQKYGRLYNWNTAKSVCPSGWHLPTDAEWTALINFVGAISTASHLKLNGFSALPGGSGNSYGNFSNIGNNGYWWTATEYYSNIAHFRSMNNGNEMIYNDSDNKSYLFSVRCLEGFAEIVSEMEHQENVDKLVKRTKEKLTKLNDYQANKTVNYSTSYSTPSRFDNIKFGIGGTWGMSDYPGKNINETFANISTAADTIYYYDAAFEGSLGMAVNIPIVSKLTFNPELYFVYRYLENRKECSKFDCYIRIDEFAINIPLIITLAWRPFIIFQLPDNDYNDPPFNVYIEAGAVLDIPLSTSVNSNSEVYIDIKKNNLGLTLGFGCQIGDFSLGIRSNIYQTTYFSLSIIARYLI